MVHQNNLFIISGPSGSGKSTLYRRLFSEYPNLYFSISATTREAREGEKDGRDYYFISIEAFEKLKEEDAFAEWALVHGNYYGTLKQELAEKTAGGSMCVLDIDVQGARSLTAVYPQAHSIFIIPPDVSAIEERLRKRETESEEQIALRIRNARKELAASEQFEYIIVNDSLEEAYKKLKSIIIDPDNAS